MARHRSAPVRRSDVPADTGHTVTATADDRGVLTGWSEGARLLLGYTREEVVGRPAADLLADDAPPRRCLDGGPGWSGPVALRHRDGRRVEGELLVRRRAAYGGADWLLVWSVRPRPPARERAGAPRELMARWGFDQSPCLLAVFDKDLRYVMVNADDEHAVGLTKQQLLGLRVSEAVPHPESERIERAMRRVLDTGERQDLETYLRVAGEDREHAWAISLAPLRDPLGRLCGVCFAARNVTEQRLAQQRLALLGEAGSHIGTTLDLGGAAHELVRAAVPRFADGATVDLFASLDRGDDPPTGRPTGPVTLRRAALHSVLDGCPETITGVGDITTFPASSPPAECLAAGRPALHEVTEEVIARWEKLDAARTTRIRAFGIHALLMVPVVARGATLGVVCFFRHRNPAPFEADDLTLAEELTARAAMSIDNARLYTRERTTAETLQRNLLPRRLPAHTAVETASRYLPAGPETGIGGDWFDVIPLSGARVALAVGDVVGHGLQSSATMGRLRTAMRTLADIDLPPDELLAHLDDLIVQMPDTADADPDTDPAGVIGTTCLYAVYDPVSRHLELAGAGHPPPAVITPGGGEAELLDLPTGPPLGLAGISGLPFEAADVELPEGSLLAFYTNGLVEDRHRGIDEGTDLLRAALARPAPNLDAVCDTVLGTLLPARPDDDVALLLARTRALRADQVATWDLPVEPASVARARTAATERLAAWGLDDAAFITELVVSELVTNAIRYGQPPVRLRLIHDRALICEVSDGSNTAPHLRRARVLDEGGRGLMLVSRLTRRWGTRHSRNGKTIWAEQSLEQPASAAGGPGITPW
jgi:PAS domain S-box-containing protein